MSATFWAKMREAAEVALRSPSWAKAGINLSERHFVTFRGES